MHDIAILFQTNDRTPMVLNDRHLEQIRAHNQGGQVRLFETEAEMLQSDLDAEILFTWGQFTPNEYCNRCTNLRWVQSLSAGLEGIMDLDIAKTPITLTKMSDVHGKPMSEHAMWFILSFLRSAPQILANQRSHIWKKPAAPPPNECRDKRVAIIGIGSIGQEVARKCKAFDMRVIGCRRTPVPMDYVDEMFPATELDTVLSEADFVVCLIPYSAESDGLFGKTQFARMKQSAVFINIGRGRVVNTEALVDALKAKVIAGAALDTLGQEPLPAESPLWGMENVIISPHCAADSPYYFDRAVDILCDNLDRYHTGKPMRYLVT